MCGACLFERLLLFLKAFNSYLSCFALYVFVLLGFMDSTWEAQGRAAVHVARMFTNPREALYHCRTSSVGSLLPSKACRYTHLHIHLIKKLASLVCNDCHVISVFYKQHCKLFSWIIWNCYQKWWRSYLVFSLFFEDSFFSQIPLRKDFLLGLRKNINRGSFRAWNMPGTSLENEPTLSVLP